MIKKCGYHFLKRAKLQSATCLVCGDKVRAYRPVTTCERCSGERDARLAKRGNKALYGLEVECLRDRVCD